MRLPGTPASRRASRWSPPLETVYRDARGRTDALYRRTYDIFG
ncbi:hypothetical protein [Streptomyces sp. NPDC046925]